VSAHFRHPHGSHFGDADIPTTTAKPLFPDEAHSRSMAISDMARCAALESVVGGHSGHRAAMSTFDPISDIESFARSGTFSLTDLSGKPLLSETFSPNDIAVDALEEAGRRRLARSELKRSKKPCFLCGTARAIRG
jgi:hypothetical protein